MKTETEFRIELIENAIQRMCDATNETNKKNDGLAFASLATSVNTNAEMIKEDLKIIKQLINKEEEIYIKKTFELK